MYLLSCPQCDAQHSVGPAQAGDQLTCRECGEVLKIPKLGDLRRLPQAEAEPETKTETRSETSLAARGGFVVFGVIGLVCLLIAGYSGIRWSLIDVPTTTDSHTSELREAYQSLTAAELIREWEEVEKYGIAATVPFDYRVTELRKQEIGNTSLMSGIGGVLAILGAFVCGIFGRATKAAS